MRLSARRRRLPCGCEFADGLDDTDWLIRCAEAERLVGICTDTEGTAAFRDAERQLAWHVQNQEGDEDE